MCEKIVDKNSYVIHVSLQDMSSQNMYDSGVALNGLACFITPDLARDLANDIMTLVLHFITTSFLLVHS